MMKSFSFPFPVLEELEYSWLFAWAETVVRQQDVRTVVREDAETDDRWDLRVPLYLQ